MKKNKLLKVLSMFLCLVMCASVFVGCGAPKTETSEAKHEETANMPKVLTMAVGAELTTLYPLNMDAQNLCATRLCYEGLVNYENGKVTPWLAEKWDFSTEGKTISFHLRKDVTYHDGTPFNAEAVKADFEFASQNPNFGAQLAVANVKNIEVVDEYTVAFHYDQSYFGYMNDFAYREIMVCVSPNVIEKENFQTMKGVVGTGPYIYSEVKDGEYVKFVKNENYWGEKPYYDEIYVKYIPEASARLQALQKGEIDMIYGSGLISWDDYKEATAMDGISGIVSPVDSRTVNIVLNAENPALSELAVREAIAYGIDKQAICDGLSYGNQKPANDMFPASNFLSDIPLKTIRTFDVSKASELLDKAGWEINSATAIREKAGQLLSFKFTYDTGEAMNKLIATTIKSQLAEIGIDVQTEGQDMMTWWKEGLAGNYGMIIWGTEENTEPQNYYPKIAERSPHVPSIVNLDGKDEFLQNIADFQTTDDMEEVTKLFTSILNYSNENVIDLPICYVKECILFRKDAIADYNFTDTPIMFEIDNVVPFLTKEESK